MKKKIKIKYMGFWEDWNPQDNYFSDILSQRYEVMLSEQPEYVICSVYGEPYAYTKYDCPRILYCGENMTPDFTVIDYAISHDRLTFEDRHFSCPSCIRNIPRDGEKPQKIVERNIDPNDINILKKKNIFCNFIYSHQSEYRIRENFFEELSKKYKQVSSAGTYLNNMPGGKSFPYSEKISFQERCKFTIAFESTRHSGFCTEKITDAFYAKTIPIYYGDPRVKEIFNPESFINISDYKNYDEVIEVIRELDNDDKAYMKMLSVPVFNDPELPKRRYRELCEFLYHIFDQEPANAFRRNRAFFSKTHNDMLYKISVLEKSKLYNTAYIYKTSGIRGIYRRIKEKIKE